MQVEVWGTQQLSKKKAKLKLNADRIVVRGQSLTQPTASPLEKILPKQATPKAQALTKPPSIKICGKPDCMKRGGKAMCKTLEKALQSGHWDPTIEVQFTGCMGKCSQGPNLVVMPDKKRYTKVTAKDIPQVLEHHFQARSA
jgi:(2Fe-2S) ferredoxin